MRKAYVLKAGLCIAIAAFALIMSCTKSGAEPSKSMSAEKGPVKVTFIELGSDKCVPCKMMQPVMKKMEETFPKDVEILFYDVWTKEEQQYAVQYGIRAIPTQIFLDENGAEYFRHEGFFPYEEVVKVLKMKGVKE